MKLVLGIDGLDKKLSEEYELSFLQRSGELVNYRSEYMSTIPSWTSIYTGLTRPEHGAPPGWRDWLFNQVKAVPTDKTVTPNGKGPINYGFDYRDLPFVWHELNDMDLRTGVIGMPLTYPPHPVKGWMISGFPAPNPLLNYCCFPSGAKNWIPKHYSTDILQLLDPRFVTNFKQIGANMMHLFENKNLNQLLNFVVEARLLATFQLTRKLPAVDVIFFGTNFVDHIGHIGGDLETAYKYTEHIITTLCDAFKPDGLLIVSDHGGVNTELPSPNDKIYKSFEHTPEGILYIEGAEPSDKPVFHEYDVKQEILNICKT